MDIASRLCGRGALERENSWRRASRTRRPSRARATRQRAATARARAASAPSRAPRPPTRPARARTRCSVCSHSVAQESLYSYTYANARPCTLQYSTVQYITGRLLYSTCTVHGIAWIGLAFAYSVQYSNRDSAR